MRPWACERGAIRGVAIARLGTLGDLGLAADRSDLSRRRLDAFGGRNAACRAAWAGHYSGDLVHEVIRARRILARLSAAAGVVLARLLYLLEAELFNGPRIGGKWIMHDQVRETSQPGDLSLGKLTCGCDTRFDKRIKGECS